MLNLRNSFNAIGHLQLNIIQCNVDYKLTTLLDVIGCVKSLPCCWESIMGNNVSVEVS